jgi:hypothetical protein
MKDAILTFPPHSLTGHDSKVRGFFISQIPSTSNF